MAVLARSLSLSLFCFLDTYLVDRFAQVGHDMESIQDVYGLPTLFGDHLQIWCNGGHLGGAVVPAPECHQYPSKGCRRIADR